MKAAIFLRVAAVLTLLHSVLHTIGGVFGKPLPGPASVAEAAMRANHFLFMGQVRTYFDFSRGLGLAVTVFLTVEGVVFWLLAPLMKQDGARLRPVLAVFVLGYVLLAVNSFVYFFPAAAGLELVIAAVLGMGIATAGQRAAAAEGARASSAVA